MKCIQDEHSSLFIPITCEVKDLRPLLADVDTDVRPSYSQVGTTLVKHEGFHLKQKNKGMTFRSTEVRESGEQRNGCQDKTWCKTTTLLFLTCSVALRSTERMYMDQLNVFQAYFQLVSLIKLLL